MKKGNYQEKLLLKKLNDIRKIFEKSDLITLYTIKRMLDEIIYRKEEKKDV